MSRYPRGDVARGPPPQDSTWTATYDYAYRSRNAVTSPRVLRGMYAKCGRRGIPYSTWQLPEACQAHGAMTPSYSKSCSPTYATQIVCVYLCVCVCVCSAKGSAKGQHRPSFVG